MGRTTPTKPQCLTCSVSCLGSTLFKSRGPGSVVGTATELRAGRSGDRISVGARFSAPVQTGPGAHLASCTMGTVSFAGVKSGRGGTLTPHPLLVPWSWKSRAIPLLPLWAVRPVQSLSDCTRVHFTFTFNKCLPLFLLLWLCILIVYLCLTTLTEVSSSFFLSCKANARVKPAKTRHGAHSSKFLCCSMYFFVLFYVLFVLFYVFLCCSMYCLFCSMYFCFVLYIVCFVPFSVLFVHIYTELLPPVGYSIAVKCVISYMLLSINLLKICFIQGISLYRAVNTFHHGYKNQSVNDVQSKSRCLFWDPYKSLNTERAPCGIFEC
jgi:hypothetical protein